MADKRNFYHEYNLSLKRVKGSEIQPLPHQDKALDNLFKWYESKHDPYMGGVLVLPTGGGKTFVAIRFLCQKALSDGYKVLWLAHTHHLLEQAYKEFESHVGKITQPKHTLRVRVVSGTKDHYRVFDISRLDDVVVATLQSITNAYNERINPALDAFLEASNEKLFIVFDEAHHAPAPSYRKLILRLRERYPKMALLGLTATPAYTNNDLEGWLWKIFPQKIIFQVTPQELMAAGILAKPKSEQMATLFTPKFDINEYEKWVKTFRDLPENIITQLAEDLGRNKYIADTYSNNRDKYGKTIIFADRWYQCDTICEFLKKRGVRAGSIYTQADFCSDGRKTPRRTNEENAHILEAFRKKKDEKGAIDVILNVRMLTEGTDVPDVNTCFITRQTTSKILLTQMVGRALRGPAVGGTKEAHLVFFTDNWQQLINWAEYEPLVGEVGIDEEPEVATQAQKKKVLIDLVRLLASQMYQGEDTKPRPFKTLIPVGWYLTEFSAVRLDSIDCSKRYESEDIEVVTRVVMVFEHEMANFRMLIDHLENSKRFREIDSYFEEIEDEIYNMREKFFPNWHDHFGSDLLQDIFNICRHFSHNEFAPKFFRFEDRELHDLEQIARRHINEDVGPLSKTEALLFEYNREDRYWKVLYPTYDSFRKHYDVYEDKLSRDLINLKNEHSLDVQVNRSPQSIQKNISYIKNSSINKIKQEYVSNHLELKANNLNYSDIERSNINNKINFSNTNKVNEEPINGAMNQKSKNNFSKMDPDNIEKNVDLDYLLGNVQKARAAKRISQVINESETIDSVSFPCVSPPKKEEVAIVLDYLPYGRAPESKSSKKQPLVQGVGEACFFLMEMTPKEGVVPAVGARVYIGTGERDVIDHVNRRIKYHQLSNAAKQRLYLEIRKIVIYREASFIEFFNNPKYISRRRNSFQLLDGIGNEISRAIIKEREKEPFKSFNDLTSRVKRLSDPEGKIAKRIEMELMDEEIKYRTFTTKEAPR